MPISSARSSPPIPTLAVLGEQYMDPAVHLTSGTEKVRTLRWNEDSNVFFSHRCPPR